MNKQRMLELADHIEGLPHRGRLQPDRAAIFDMGHWWIGNEHTCGTMGCIAGWAANLFEVKRPSVSIQSSWVQLVREILDLSYAEARTLCVPDTNLAAITPAQAAGTLRLMASGCTAERAWTQMGVKLNEYE